jgi:putative membrane protein
MFITHLVLHLVALAVTVMLLARFLPSVKVKSLGSAFAVAIVFSVLNVLLGWLIRGLLFVPALFTLGLLFLFVPFIVNAVLLWLTDKLVGSFAIETMGGLLASAAAITVVNALLHIMGHTHHLRFYGAGPTRWI